jgi:rRNA processing protein Krr1/Pno1
VTDADIQIPVLTTEEARTLLGPLDSNARLIRELHGVSVLVRDGSLRLLGDPLHVHIVQQALEESLLTLPILYLSRFIIQNKADYYRLLRKVTSHNAWEEWVLYMASRR